MAETDQINEWKKICVKAEQRFRELFPGCFPDWLHFFETDPAEVRRFMELPLRSVLYEERIDCVFRLFGHLNGVILGDQDKEGTQIRVLELTERFTDDNAIAERLLANNFRSPQDLEELFKERFVMIKSQNFINNESKGFVIGTVFRKT